MKLPTDPQLRTRCLRMAALLEAALPREAWQSMEVDLDAAICERLDQASSAIEVTSEFAYNGHKVAATFRLIYSALIAEVDEVAEVMVTFEARYTDGSTGRASVRIIPDPQLRPFNQAALSRWLHNLAGGDL